MTKRTQIQQIPPGALVPGGEPRRYLNSYGYMRLRWKTGLGQYIECYEHRVFDGRVTVAEHVHHINRDRADNRPENLRRLSADEHAMEHGPTYADDVVQRYLAGNTTTAIGRALGVHPSTVSRLLERRGVERRNSGEVQRHACDGQLVAQLHAEGVRVLQIAQRLGVHREVVNRTLDELGLPRFRVGRPAVPAVAMKL